MTESEKKPEVKVGDKVGGRRVLAVADAGYYSAPMSSYTGKPIYDQAKFIRTA